MEINKSPELELPPGVRYLAFFLLTGLIFLHVIPYIGSYNVPHYDYFNVIHVVLNMTTPELFGADRLSEAMVELATRTAPIYFYGLVYPISFLLPPKGILLSFGVVISIGSVYLAGGSWKRYENLLLAVFIIFILLHSTVSPLEGNRRSFTSLFLLAILWFDKKPSFLVQGFIVGLAAGIYPPVALIALTYFSLRNLRSFFNNSERDLFVTILKTGGLVTIFLFVLTPYWSNLLFAEGFEAKTNFGPHVKYQLDTASGWFNTFLTGDKGALFRDQIHFDLLLGLISLLLLQVATLGTRFVLHERYVLLLVTGIVLWGLAHFLHPIIYHPFKYTRLTLILGLAIPVGLNLPQTSQRFHEQFGNQIGLRILLYATALIPLSFWLFFVLNSVGFEPLLNLGILGRTGWKFTLVLPIFLSLLIGLPGVKSHAIRSLVGVLILSALLFLPHPFSTIQRHGIKLSNFSGMYDFLRKSPKGSLVAGPPRYFMDPIPAYGKRAIFSSTSKAYLQFVCDRNKRFRRIYFQNSLARVLQFMKDNDVDFLLVDRRLLNERILEGYYRCMGQIEMSPNPALNQHFSGAEWQFNRRLYLIDQMSLKRKINGSPSN